MKGGGEGEEKGGEPWLLTSTKWNFTVYKKKKKKTPIKQSIIFIQSQYTRSRGTRILAMFELFVATIDKMFMKECVFVVFAISD